MAAGRPQARARERAPERADDRRFRELMLPHLDAAYTLARYLMRDSDGGGGRGAGGLSARLPRL